MTTPTLLPETLIEGTTGHYDFTMDVDAAFLMTLTVSLLDAETGVPLHGRDHQDILNTNGGSVTTDQGPPLVTTILLELSPADTSILNETRRVEYRILDFRWTWDGGLRHGAHLVQFGIDNTASVP